MQQNDFVSWITQSVAIIGFEFMYKDLQLDKKNFYKARKY